MKPIHFLIAGVAALASAACNAEQQPQGNGGAVTSNSGPLQNLQRPASGDWSEAVTATHEGGFLMGNPDAQVKLVEFGSMTCPACAVFEESAMEPLVEKYVKAGTVSFEFRNYVRDPYDITAALIARCNGAQSFFPLTGAMFKDQSNWLNKLQQVPPAELEALQTLPPNQQFSTIAKWAGFQQFAAMRGVPTAKSSQCLANQQEIDRLVQMNSDATSQHNIAGTPSFLFNGKVFELQRTTPPWQQIEARIQETLGG